MAGKDVMTLNEVDALSRLMQDLNDFLVEREDNGEYVVKGVNILVGDDKTKRTGEMNWGTITKWPSDADIQFEPGFVPELMGPE